MCFANGYLGVSCCLSSLFPFLAFLLYTMHSILFSLLALSGTVVSQSDKIPFSELDSQQVLGNARKSSNFIANSIFGRNDVRALDHREPKIITPTFLTPVDDFWYSGLGTFAHLDFTDCTKSENSGTFDIGIVGHPFDLGVSYRPGARFGPNGARQGARRLSPAAGWEYV